MPWQGQASGDVCTHELPLVQCIWYLQTTHAVHERIARQNLHEYDIPLRMLAAQWWLKSKSKSKGEVE